MRTIGFVFVALFSLFLFSCSREIQLIEKSNFKIEKALTSQKLPKEYQDLFEQWKKLLLKKCDARSVFFPSDFENNTVSFKGLDKEILFKSNGIVWNPQGEFVLLQKKQELNFTSITEIQIHAHQIQFRLNQGKCEVFFSNEKVFETTLLDEVIVIGHFSEEKRVEKGKEKFFNPNFIQQQNSASNMTGQIFIEPLIRAFNPDDSTAIFLSKTLDLSLDDVHKFFVFKNFLEFPHTIFANDILDSTPFNKNQVLIWAPIESLKYFQYDGKIERIFSLIIQNVNENSSWDIQTRFKFERFSNTNTEVSLEFVHLMRPRNHDHLFFNDCLNKRLQLLTNRVFSFNELVEPCLALTNDLYEEILKDKNLLKELFHKSQNIFSNSISNHSQQLETWIQFYQELIRKTPVEISFSQAFNLDEKHTFFQKISIIERQFFQNFYREEISEAVLKELRCLIIRFLIKFGTIHFSEIKLILEVIERLESKYDQSIIHLLKAIEHPSQIEELTRFARHSPDTVFDEFNTFQKKADHLDLKNWLFSTKQNFLLIKPSIERIKKWNQTLDHFLTFNLTGPEKVLVQALNEEWLDKDFQTMQKIAVLSKSSRNCNSYSELGQIIACIGLDKFSKKSRGLLNSNYNWRYGDLAKEFNTAIEKLNESKAPIANNIINTFWLPVWASCNDDEFLVNKLSFLNLVKLIETEKTLIKRMHLESTLLKLLSECS